MNLYERLVKHIIITLVSFTTEQFLKNGQDFTACNNASAVLYNTDITSVDKLTVHSPVLLFLMLLLSFECVCLITYCCEKKKVFFFLITD